MKGFLLLIAGGVATAVLPTLAGTLSEQALLDRVQARHEQAGDHLRRCGTPLIVEARQSIRDPALRATWEKWGQVGSAGLGYSDRVLLQQTARGLAPAVSEFAVWNYFTGPRHRPGQFYAEGEKYLAVRARSPDTPGKVAVQERDFLDHLASAYLRLKPRQRPGGLALQFSLERGQWRVQLLLIGPNSLHIQTLGAEPAQVAGWEVLRGGAGAAFRQIGRTGVRVRTLSGIRPGPHRPARPPGPAPGFRLSQSLPSRPSPPHHLPFFPGPGQRRHHLLHLCRRQKPGAALRPGTPCRPRPYPGVGWAQLSGPRGGVGMVLRPAPDLPVPRPPDLRPRPRLIILQKGGYTTEPPFSRRC